MKAGQIFIDYLQRAFNWQENQASKLWTRRFTFRDFNGVAATTSNKDITDFNGAVQVLGAYIWVLQNFAGPSIATATFSVGTTGTPTKYVNAGDVFSGAGVMRTGVTQTPGQFINTSAPTDPGTVRFQLIVSGANADQLNAGIVQVFMDLRPVKLRTLTSTG